MTWVKLDDGFFSHPRAIAAGKDGRALFVAGLCWCKSYLTDGIIPKSAGQILAAQADVPARRTIATLTSVGLWHDEGDHWRVNDWHQHQETAEYEKNRKSKKAERQRRWLEKARDARKASQETRHETGRETRQETVQWPLPDTDTDTDTDTEDIEIPPSPSLVDRRAADGGGGEVISIMEALVRTVGIGEGA